jgi:hypothetical protein
MARQQQHIIKTAPTDSIGPLVNLDLYDKSGASPNTRHLTSIF